VRGLRVAVVGCGTAGGAAALLLARAGHRVTVYERVPDPRPVGAGIVLQPTGISVLARLGLLGEVVARGARLEALRCVTSRGRTVVHLPYATLGRGLFGLGIHRGVLFDSLFRAAVAEPGVELRRGEGIDGLASGADGRFVVGDDGERRGPFDLVVVADGARSQLRDDTRLVRRERLYRWGAIWFVADDPEGVYQDELFQVVDGTRRFLGLLPTGLGPGAGEAPSKVSLFWSLPEDRLDAFRRSGLAPWREAILRYDPRAEFVVDQIDDIETVLFARYHDVVMRRWHTGDVVYLGDAAHAMSPQLGQGANLALCDASALADCVEAAERVDEALAAYSTGRRRQLAFYQLATRWLTPLFQSDLSLLAPLRDWGMGIACRLPPVRAQMIRTMCGIKRGILRPSLPLEPLRAALPPG